MDITQTLFLLNPEVMIYWSKW